MPSHHSASQPSTACEQTQANPLEPNGTKVGNDKDKIPPGTLEALFRIAEERNEYLAHLKDALLRNDVEALELYASKLCGFTDWPAIREAERKKYAAESSHKKKD